MRTGGRQKGTKNKNKTRVQEMAEKLGVEPFEILLHFASNNWNALGYPRQTITKQGSTGESYEVDVISAKDRLFAASEAANYMYPKRKAVDMSHELDVSGELDVKLNKKDLIKDLAKDPASLRALEQISSALKKKEDAGS